LKARRQHKPRWRTGDHVGKFTELGYDATTVAQIAQRAAGRRGLSPLNWLRAGVLGADGIVSVAGIALGSSARAPE
jgi:hypothetical protein